MTETLHLPKDAAKQLGISVWTLRKKAYEGEVASVKIGTKLLIPESELERLIREGRRPRSKNAPVATTNLSGALHPRNRREPSK